MLKDAYYKFRNHRPYLSDDSYDDRDETDSLDSSTYDHMKEGESSFASSELSDDGDVQIKCKIGLHERLILSRPVWFLPGIQRAGALHLLQGKEEGIFIVRQSTKPASIALSVRLPPDKGPYVEHYLIQTLPGKKLSLETSSFQFDSLQSLIAHYCQHCDELPVQLKLPFILYNSQSRQELSSLALLGQEFWSHSLSSYAGLGDLGKKCVSLSSLSVNKSSPLNICETDAMTKIIVHDNKICKHSVLHKSSMDSKPFSTFKGDYSHNQPISPSPPPPPPRWSKPTLISPIVPSDQNNFECTLNTENGSKKFNTASSPQIRRKPKILDVPENNCLQNRRYSCDVLTPPFCYKSSLAEKESDYEDIWTSPTDGKTLASTLEGKMTSFKKIDSSVSKSYSVQKNSSSLSSNLSFMKKGKVSLHLSTPSVCRQTAPLYEDPNDQRIASNLYKRSNHHSDPSLLICSPYLTNSLEGLTHPRSFLYLSADNVMALNRSVTSEGDETVISSDPKCESLSINSPKSGNETSWALDSSWEFMESNDHEVPERDSNIVSGTLQDKKFPTSVITVNDLDTNKDKSEKYSEESKTANQDIVSDYDNIEKKLYYPSSILSEDSTEFSEPWDNSKWLENMPSNEHEVQHLQQFIDNVLYRKDLKDSDSDSVIQLNVADNALYPVLVSNDDHNDYNEGCVYPPKLLRLTSNQRCPEASNRIRNHVVELAKNEESTFAKKIKYFIECTKESSELNPHHTLRNVRQFMSGIKNYLVKSELDFTLLVDKERQGLKSTEFLNIDEILEEELHKLLLLPLKEYIYKLFAMKLSDSSGLFRSHKFMFDKLGVKKDYLEAANSSVKLVSSYMKRMQDSYSPLVKQEVLHLTIASVFRQLRHSTTTSTLSLPVEQFQTVFAYILSETKLLHLEVESEYMWGLLPSSRRVGEWGYYLTLLSGALQLLNKVSCNAPESMKENDIWGSLRILLPDENSGTIVTKTIPVRASSTTHDIMTLVAHKQKITNPQDYGLYSLVQGVENLLNDSDFPQKLKIDLLKSGQVCSFVYRRQDAKIAWPKDTNS